MDLRKFIQSQPGTNAKFARFMGVDDQTVSRWIKTKYVAFDGYLWKRMRKIKGPAGMTSTETSDAVQGALSMLYFAKKSGVMTERSIEITANKIYKIMNGVGVKTLNDYLIEGGVASEQRVESEKQGQEESSGN